jgi:hypothetical protein
MLKFVSSFLKTGRTGMNLKFLDHQGLVWEMWGYGNASPQLAAHSTSLLTLTSILCCWDLKHVCDLHTLCIRAPYTSLPTTALGSPLEPNGEHTGIIFRTWHTKALELGLGNLRENSLHKLSRVHLSVTALALWLPCSLRRYVVSEEKKRSSEYSSELDPLLLGSRNRIE